MRKRISILAALISLFVLCAQAQQEQRYALLPATEIKLLQQMYPKKGPNRVDGAWQPTPSQIETLETNLPHIADLRSGGAPNGERIEHPEKYFRQYLAVVRAGRNLIYVNALCDVNSSPDWRSHLAAVTDGGSCFWQSWYDPSTGKFTELWVNGRA